jgi:diaminobutyrate-2-oxoglutarate transaminase
MAGIDTLGYLQAVLDDTHSGIEVPAAVIIETVQAEGGVVVAPTEWLRGLRELCTERKILLIVDDIQVGCGRTGPFFSFEWAGITPDIVTLSKSISGYGLPMSLVLMRAELDVWQPAEHTGTFRGNQAAFVAAATALEVFEDEKLEAVTAENGVFLANRLHRYRELHDGISLRGLGMIWGIDLTEIDATGGFARDVSRTCFERGLIIERVGRNDTVLKVLAPLNIDREPLDRGCEIVEGAIRDNLVRRPTG